MTPDQGKPEARYATHAQDCIIHTGYGLCNCGEGPTRHAWFPCHHDFAEFVARFGLWIDRVNRSVNRGDDAIGYYTEERSGLVRYHPAA